MKQIIVSNCVECPYRYGSACLKTGTVRIKNDCPLADRVSRDEAREIIMEFWGVKNANENIGKYLDKLGFKKEDK